MPIIAPLNSSHTVRKNIGTIGLIPSHYIAVLLSKLPQIRGDEVA